MLNFTILLLLLSISATAFAQVFKWTDDNGVTHYSDNKSSLENTEAEEITDRLHNKSNVLQFKKVPISKAIKTSHSDKAAGVKVNIELINYQLTAHLQQTIQKNVNAIHQAYVQWFGWNPKPKRPLTIKIFGKYADFEQYQKQHSARVSNRSHYSTGRKEVLMLGTEFSLATVGVLYHESSHAILDFELPYASKWINEGLAEMFETVRLVATEPAVGTNPEWLEIIKHKLREGSLLPFGQYASISNSSWVLESTRVERSYYMVAWSMMRFLVSSNTGKNTLRNVMLSCKVKVCWGTDELSAVLAENFKGGMGELDRQWRDWIRQI